MTAAMASELNRSSNRIHLCVRYHDVFDETAAASGRLEVDADLRVMDSEMVSADVGDAARHLAAECEGGTERSLEEDVGDLYVGGGFGVGDSVFIPATLDGDCIMCHGNGAVLNAYI